MDGIDLNKPIRYLNSSLWFYREGQNHCERICEDDVLLMVYKGVLRFEEDGVSYEIYPGQYHIQKRNTFQTGKAPCDKPKYFWVHFRGCWGETNNVLSRSGEFDYNDVKPIIDELDKKSHQSCTLLEKSKLFYELLWKLYTNNCEGNIADKIAGYIRENSVMGVSLEDLARKFNFSKNYIIKVFKNKYGVTPIKYLNEIRIKRAMQQLATPGAPAEVIALNCGFNTYSHFYKLFLRMIDMSPNEWRSQVKLNPKLREEYKDL